MAVFSPDFNFTRFSLNQHISALADQYFYPLQKAGKKEQILEIKAFNQAICSVDTDEKIYKIISQKLNFFEQQGSLEPGFWADLVKVLIFMFINVNPKNDQLDPQDFYLSEVLHALNKMTRPSQSLRRGSEDSEIKSISRLGSPVYQQLSELASSLSEKEKEKQQQQVPTSTFQS